MFEICIAYENGNVHRHCNFYVFHILSYIYIYSAIHLVACSAIQTLMHTVRGNIVADVEIKNSD